MSAGAPEAAITPPAGDAQLALLHAGVGSDSSPLLASTLAEFEPASALKTLRFTNGDVYEGETLGDLRHGKGRHVCSNGDTHEGGWYKGMRHGRGVATFVRGFHYEGDFEFDHAHGSGKALYETGAVYEGEFEQDQRSGWGVQAFPDESTYVGEWASDQMSGKGRLTSKDGSFFEGTWAAGAREAGRWVSADGRQEYSGQWRGEARHGDGTLHIAGLLQYSGQWCGDLQHGWGKMRWADGSAYDGQWQQGQRHGKGVLQRTDGYKYDGEWREDKEHGVGNARLQNGDRYSGDFAAGVASGAGRVLTPAGERFSGDWVGGKRQGRGSCVYENGDRYTGEWAAGRRHGEGCCRFADGTLFRGEWQEDQWLQSEAEPSLSAVAGAGLAGAVAGREACFQILARDAGSNKRLAGGDSFVAWLEGPATVHAIVVDQGDGSYSASYCTNAAGVYALYVTNDTGESVADSPYRVRVLPGPPQPHASRVRLDCGAPAAAGSPAAFEVQAHDQFGNKCLSAALASGLPIDCCVSAGRGPLDVAVQASHGGCYRCSFVPPSPGYYRVAVTSGGRPLGNSPASLQVAAAPAEGAAAPPEAAAGEGGVRDAVAEWVSKAARQYGADGDMGGWSSGSEEEETAEQKYIKAHPETPVVERLEDMWRVTQLQRERRAAQAREAALAEMRALVREGSASSAATATQMPGASPAEVDALAAQLQQGNWLAAEQELGPQQQQAGAVPAV